MSKLKFTLKACLVITLVTIGLSCLTQWAAAVFWGVELPDQAQLEMVRNLAGWNWRFFECVVLVLVLSPLVEEFVFRFLLWKLPIWAILKRKQLWARAWVAAVAVATAAVFSAAHYVDWVALESTHKLVWIPLSSAFIALFFFGLAQCWLYYRTSYMWCAILNHALFNLVNLVLIFLV